MASLPRSAAANDYQPQSVSELIAYLQGVIATLEAQLQAQGSVPNVVNSTPTINSGTIDTLTVQSIGVESVVLRGRVNADYVNALVWFEYGQASLTDFSTPRQRIDNNRQIFSASLTDLRRNNTYSYRAVLELSNGSRYYGTIGTFTTGRSYNNNEPNFNSGNSNLTIDKTRYNLGETIRVNWNVPNDKKSDRNWVGVYRVGSSNNSYSSWKTASNQTGQLNLTAPTTAGDYELRIFYNYGYELIATSRTFTVN
jgi:hypothetical protein